MLIQINTDHNIEGGEAMNAHFTETLNDMLGRFDEHITRLEVHLKDVNGSKDIGNDKHCAIEARLKGLNPIIVNAEADEVHRAVKAAAEKLKVLLDKTIQSRNGR